MAFNEPDIPPGFHLRTRSWRGILVHGMILMTLWLLLSGHYDVFHISLGVVSVVLVLVGNSHLNRIQFFTGDLPEWERARAGRVLRYIPWLVWQIVVASLQVAYVVLSPKIRIDPCLLHFRAKLPNVGAAVILGNSITLTPGTLTIEIRKDEFLVHSLMDESMGGLIDGTMPTMVARLFRARPADVVSDIRIVRSHRS
jgi:multicomponent Na+:H+ antiporter subunit E